MAKKIVNSDYHNRLASARKELIGGKSRYQLLIDLRNGKCKWYPDSDKRDIDTLKSFIEEAVDTCRFETEVERDKQKALHLERYLDLYSQCNEVGDRTNARQILSDIAKLMGLNEKEKKQIETTTYELELV